MCVALEAFGLTLLAAGRVASQAVPPRTPLAIEHATVVDVRDGRLLRDQTVLVAGNKVVAVGPSSDVRRPRDARAVDARGAYLIPGLWDMHHHSAEKSAQTRSVFFPIEVANGVTGARDMFGSRSALAAKRDIAHGTLLGPRLVVGSPILDGPVPMWDGSIPIATAADGRRVVDSLADQGYDFIKIYQFLSRDAYFGIADAARRRGIPFAGHLPFSVSAGEASDAGQRTVEHEIGIALACSADESRIRGSLVAAAATVPAGLPPHGALLGRGEDEPLATFSAAKCDTLFARFVKNDTWVVPTLIMHRMHAVGRDSSTRHDARLRYIPSSVHREWEGMVTSRPAFVDAAFHRVDPAGLTLVGAMHRAHVSMLVGTDAMNPFVIPGFAVHQELALLVDAGLTPLEALRAATILPATFLRATDSLGTIAPGKLADLVLLEGNPLADIHNTSRIRAVVLDGRYLDRQALDSLLAGAERAAAKP